MKGITHFVSGIAAATFIPGVVEQAAAGSLLPVLGGVFGLLPDTLDFKFARYFERAEQIDPDPRHPDPQLIADRLAEAIDRAYKRNQPVRVRLHTMKLGVDLWRQYTVRFDAENGEIAVRIGPTVNTSQLAYAGSEIEGLKEARAKVEAPLVYTYGEEMKIDIFGGPSFAFKRVKDKVEIQFLPWHRSWSHSLVLAAFLGLATGLLLNATLGWVIFAGMAVHILEDQLGYMGSNLFWPLTENRAGGLRLIHSGDPIPNFVTVWTALVLILFNLDRFSGEPPFFQPVVFLTFALAVPVGGLLSFYFMGKRRGYQTIEAAKQADVIQELVETEV
ncbi:MAG TPA: metal-dependent hydrolase [Anaerolineae bacterium]|nr:metal-dependent hydrolase [Anaerolineae bacterium]